MAKSSQDILVESIDSDVTRGKRVIAHLMARDIEEITEMSKMPEAVLNRFELERELATRVFALSQKIARLQVLKARSQAEPSEVDSLAKRFVSIMQIIAKASKGKSRLHWVIPYKAVISTRQASKGADRIIKRAAKRKTAKRPAKEAKPKNPRRRPGK